MKTIVVICLSFTVFSSVSVSAQTSRGAKTEKDAEKITTDDKDRDKRGFIITPLSATELNPLLAYLRTLSPSVAAAQVVDATGTILSSAPAKIVAATPAQLVNPAVPIQAFFGNSPAKIVEATAPVQTPLPSILSATAPLVVARAVETKNEKTTLPAPAPVVPRPQYFATGQLLANPNFLVAAKTAPVVVPQSAPLLANPYVPFASPLLPASTSLSNFYPTYPSAKLVAAPLLPAARSIHYARLTVPTYASPYASQYSTPLVTVA